MSMYHSAPCATGQGNGVGAKAACCAAGATHEGHEALLDLCRGQRARVHSIHATGELGRRLRDMGLLPGVELTVTGRAPLGCPLSISLDGYDLSLRCEEAKLVWVDRADDASAADKA